MSYSNRGQLIYCNTYGNLTNNNLAEIIQLLVRSNMPTLSTRDVVWVLVWIDPLEYSQRPWANRDFTYMQIKLYQSCLKSNNNLVSCILLFNRTSFFNRLTPNDSYMGRTARLTSKRCILYIYSTNTGTEYFKHALYSLFFLLKMQFVS